MKKTISFLAALLAVCLMGGIVAGCGPKQDPCKDAIQKIIVDAKVPLIQLESNFNGEKFSYQIENPNFYDSVKIAAGEATPQPAIFQAASLSKVVFSYIVMKMYDRGEIDLDTPICNYTDIDRFEDMEQAAKLTARMVLTHRTGLPNWSASPSSQEWPTAPITFKFPVDSCYGYSGEGFAYLQRAVEKIRGKKIDEVAKEEVFQPLGMAYSSYEWQPVYDTLAVDGYNKDGENRGKGRHPRANVGYTLRTCAADYAKFLQAILDGTGLSPQVKELWQTPCKEKAVRYAGNHRDCDNSIAWALGMGTEDNPEFGKVLWHWGDNGSFKALFIVIPSANGYLAYFTNSNHGHDIINDITALVIKNKEPFAINDWINMD